MVKLKAFAVLGAALAACGTAATTAGAAGKPKTRTAAAAVVETTTPIQHLVVIFQENVSFDHYFATYPNAANPGSDEPTFTPKRSTGTVNNENQPFSGGNNENAAQPFRLDRSQFETCDQDHNYNDEQAAAHAGLMDLFVEKVGRGGSVALNNGTTTTIPCDYGKGPGLVMGYYDGNTVTAFWNYAQSFAMSDNSYDTVFGPSTPGAINLVSGQTHGFGPDFNPITGTTGTAVTAATTIVGRPAARGRHLRHP